MFIGVDIGGTNTKVGIVSKLGRVIAIDTFKTRVPRDAGDLVDEIYKVTDKLLKANEMTLDNIEGIGVGVPGIVNDNGMVVLSVNLGWKDLDFTSLIEKRFEKKVVIGNDANCAMLSEWRFGGAKGAKNATLITVGTGIGAGIILDGKVFRGTNGMGGECGHMVIVQNGEPCNCGNRGCWEQYASAKSLARRTEIVAKENPSSKLNDVIASYKKASAHTCFEAAKMGDKVAKDLVDEYVDYVVCGLINLTQIFRPEIFIIGGGVAKEGYGFIKLIDTKLNNFITKNNMGAGIQVKRPVLENNAGIVGAACLAMNV